MRCRTAILALLSSTAILLGFTCLGTGRAQAADRAQQAQEPTAHAQASDNPAEPVPTIRVSSRLVVVNVVVTDNEGHPVKGLKPSDFTITEDGIVQHINNFSEHQATPENNPPASEPSLPPNTFAVRPPLTEEGMKTVIVLNNITYPNDPMVRGDIKAFMKTVAPGNPIAIVRIYGGGMHLVQDFTSDPQLLQDAVASHRMLLPLPGTTGSMPHLGPINPYQRLARYLSGIPGRINLAWITDEGESDDFRGPEDQEFPGLTNMVRSLNGSANFVKLGRIVPYVIKAGGYIGGILQPDSRSELMPSANGGLLANIDMAHTATAAGGHAFFDGSDKALSQIMALGSNYYALYYVPTNPRWNGAYRKIAIKVSGVTNPPPTRFGWSDYGQPNVVYNSGYFARSKPDLDSVAGSTTFGIARGAFQTRQLLSGSLPGVVPISVASPDVIPRTTSAMEVAMGFGTLTPNQVNFTIGVTPSPQVEKPRSGTPSTKDNFITAPFRDTPYRNYTVHYRIDSGGLKFSRTANGFYRDNLQFVAMLYFNDGQVANFAAITAHIQFPVGELDDIHTSGVTFDQTIAIPTTDKRLPDSFFLRMGVSETSTGRIGTLEIPVDWIQLPSIQIDGPIVLAGK